MSFFFPRYLPHVLIAGLAVLSLLLPEVTTAALLAAARWFFVNFDWLTLLAVGAALIFCLAVAVLPLGTRRLGGAEARPEFHTVTWFAMLFATGMGAGLVFWGAAEPLIFYLSPPPGGPVPESEAARFEALALTQFHWSLHAWAVYAVSALVVAIGTRAPAAPLPSQPFATAPRRYRRLIDWLAIFAVIFGLVASLGQGVIQMGAGVSVITDGALADGMGLQMLLLFFLTAAFLASVARGLRKGIALLSNINLAIAVCLALFVLIFGPTMSILQTFMDSVWAYSERFLSLSFTLRPEGPGRQWTHDWSLTYFLWWIAWAPFVGVFIARISRGRSLREFVAGVVFVPVLVTLVWFSIFGGAALYFTEAGVDFGVRDFATAPSSAYVLMEQLPLTTITQALTFALVFVFLLTSADSGAYVLAMFSRGLSDPPIGERFYWGMVLALLTAGAIMTAQGQTVTRAFAVTGAIPLTMLLIAQGGATAFRGFRPPPRLSSVER